MSDALAAGVVRGAIDAGLRVPADLSVVGFDGVPLGALTEPPLTTVAQPTEHKGELAAQALLRALEPDGAEGEAADPPRTILPAELVARDDGPAAALSARHAPAGVAGGAWGGRPRARGRAGTHARGALPMPAQRNRSCSRGRRRAAAPGPSSAVTNRSRPRTSTAGWRESFVRARSAAAAAASAIAIEVARSSRP
jgi:hypothetical protein